MKRKEQDILQNSHLKESPFGVPENYFSNLNENLKGISGRSKVVTFRKWATYAAIAASFALLVAAGGMLLKWSDNQLPNGYAEAHEITDEDIMEYLIYTGVDIEDLEDLDLY